MTEPSTPTVINTTTAAVPGTPSGGNPPLVVFNTAAHIPLKLSSSNYVVWSFQFRTLLVGYDLFRFLDGSLPGPTPLSIVLFFYCGSNPLHAYWIRQDQLILSAIIGFIEPPSLISFIAATKSSREAWEILAAIYGETYSWPNTHSQTSPPQSVESEAQMVARTTTVSPQPTTVFSASSGLLWHYLSTYATYLCICDELTEVASYPPFI
ncbi:hypothetical protein ACS0TY_025104 [Phlomoides rotata]